MLGQHSTRFEPEIKDSFSVGLYSDPSSSIAFRLSYHRILLVENGRGTLVIDDTAYKLSPGQLYLIAKGQILNTTNSSDISATEIRFGDCFWDRTPSSANNCKAVLFNNAADNQCLALNEKDMPELQSLFSTLQDEFNRTTYINKLDVMAAYLKIIMIKIANMNASLTEGYDNHDKQLYRRFLELVSRDYSFRHEVFDYSKELNITSRRLTELCKRSSGKTAKDIIAGQLIAEAKRNLQFSSFTIKQIAYKLNFATPEQFSHFFKKNAQSSPSEFRTSSIGLSN
ncbi:DNA-binding transcriptional regulator AraC [compost metagenome]